jgi:hypothetical protein
MSCHRLARFFGTYSGREQGSEAIFVIPDEGGQA